MTLKQLLNETYALGFDEGAELTDSFIFAANRALVRIVSELGSDSIGRITVPKDSRELIASNITLTDGDSFTAELSGAAYSAVLSGKGTLEINSGGKRALIPFSGSAVVQRGFISGSGTLTVAADSYSEISALATFKFTDAKSESEIPLFSDPRKINLKSFIPDFFRATAPPQSDTGMPLSSVALVGDHIYPDRDFYGAVTIQYKRYPRRITRDSENLEIDVPRELETLLPLLSASYVWLDDDAERAQYYLELYHNEAARIKRAFPSYFGGFVNVTGWA